MIGLRGGIKVGPMGGPRVGIGADQIASQGPPPTTLTVALADSADPVITGGDAFSLTAVVENTGSVDATTVTLTVTLDASLSYVSGSGSGWTVGHSAGVVTCTRASIATGATAPTVTINVTTGSSGVTASSSASVSASNTSAPGVDVETTTVNLVDKDATAGIYLPSSSTQWTNFIARKGLSIAVPSALWLLQEPSGNPVDSIGGFTLTAAGSLAYQQAEAGWSRTGVKFTDGGTGTLSNSSASLPSIASASMTTLMIANATASTSATRVMLQHGSGTINRVRVTSTPRLAVLSNGNTATGTVSPLNAVRPYALRSNRTAASCVGTSDTEKLTPTFDATVTGKGVVFGLSSQTPTFNVLYACNWHNANAEISDATLKALLQAMGFTITWS